MCPQAGCFPWSRPMPHTHANIGQGGQFSHANLLNILAENHHAISTKAFIDALGINADQVDGEEAAAIVTAARVNPVITKAAIEALTILHSSTSGRTANDHHAQAHNLDTHAVRNHANLQNVTSAQHHALPSLGELTMGLGCKVYRNSSQTIPTGTWTKILFDTEVFDVGADFAGNQYTVPSNGYYLVIVKASMMNIPANDEIGLEARMNGTAFSKAHRGSGAVQSDEDYLICASFEYLTSGQVITGYIWHNAGSDKSMFGLIAQTYICVVKLGV